VAPAAAPAASRSARSRARRASALSPSGASMRAAAAKGGSHTSEERREGERVAIPPVRSAARPSSLRGAQRAHVLTSAGCGSVHAAPRRCGDAPRCAGASVRRAASLLRLRTLAHKPRPWRAVCPACVRRCAASPAASAAPASRARGGGSSSISPFTVSPSSSHGSSVTTMRRECSSFQVRCRWRPRGSCVVCEYAPGGLSARRAARGAHLRGACECPEAGRAADAPCRVLTRAFTRRAAIRACETEACMGKQAVLRVRRVHRATRPHFQNPRRT
jgi:hypothetical protein